MLRPKAVLYYVILDKKIIREILCLFEQNGIIKIYTKCMIYAVLEIKDETFSITNVNRHI